jgi:hypothetical protein
MPPSSILRKDIKHLIHRHSSFPFSALNDFLPTHFILPQRSVCTQRTQKQQGLTAASEAVCRVIVIHYALLTLVSNRQSMVE